MLYICYAEDAGYYLINEQGYIHSARWFSDIDAAENYCYMNSFDFDYNFDMEAAWWLNILLN